MKGRRSSERRMEKCFTRPTLKATPGDLSLVIPKRQLDNIIEMIYALDKIAPEQQTKTRCFTEWK